MMRSSRASVPYVWQTIRDALGGKDVVVAQYGYDAGDVVAPPYVASAAYGVPACGCEE